MQEPPISKGKVFNWIGKAALSVCRSWKTRYRIAKFAERQMSKYPFTTAEKVTELTTRYRYMKNEYPKQAFESAVRVPFEDHLIPIPAGYDTYLRMAFGNYMELPPKNERAPRHDAVMIDIHNSYKKYKGIYYNTDG